MKVFMKITQTKETCVMFEKDEEHCDDDRNENKSESLQSVRHVREG